MDSIMIVAILMVTQLALTLIMWTALAITTVWVYLDISAQIQDGPALEIRDLRQFIEDRMRQHSLDMVRELIRAHELAVASRQIQVQVEAPVALAPPPQIPKGLNGITPHAVYETPSGGLHTEDLLRSIPMPSLTDGGKEDQEHTQEYTIQSDHTSPSQDADLDRDRAPVWNQPIRNRPIERKKMWGQGA